MLEWGIWGALCRFSALTDNRSVRGGCLISLCLLLSLSSVGFWGTQRFIYPPRWVLYCCNISVDKQSDWLIILLCDWMGLDVVFNCLQMITAHSGRPAARKSPGSLSRYSSSMETSHTRACSHACSPTCKAICTFACFWCLMHMSLCIQCLHHHELVRNYLFIHN